MRGAGLGGGIVALGAGGVERVCGRTGEGATGSRDLTFSDGILRSAFRSFGAKRDSFFCEEFVYFSWASPLFAMADMGVAAMTSPHAILSRLNVLKGVMAGIEQLREKGIQNLRCKCMRGVTAPHILRKGANGCRAI
jgi:hypothetical protein